MTHTRHRENDHEAPASDVASRRNARDARGQAAGWPHPLLVALALASLVVVLDALIPGLPGSRAGMVGRLMVFMSGICPQRPAHSYTLGGVQLPIEARMMGMFGGLVVGIVELATIGRQRSRRWPRRAVTVALALGFSAMAFDGVNALFFDVGLPHLYAPDLRVRLGTGILAGLAMAFALAPALAFVTENGERESAGYARPGWRDLGCALAGGILVAVGVASGWSPLLYPAALLGAIGVTLTWLLINLIVLVGLFDAWPVTRRWAWPGWRLGALAAALAIAELAALAMLRAAIHP